ncbi:PREDICTED: protein FAR1-RELATED SEQUENCE 5-like [Ipomoea nil]|uniref:protein FAR1-RELATED SEQUENCE 5-like n=1 Tax=Ipomoea nil TaxID=35883 RepID=UPI00090100A4|nr:PREDICTED: protein FAR1-RELATED SEQUENCE 5-like [Ipomoea nil]
MVLPDTGEWSPDDIDANEPEKDCRMEISPEGGPENVGATQQDFKNYRRDLLAYMKWGDVQMVISNYLELKTECADMYFEYEVNTNDQLARVFWADGMARKNYGAFGDVVSFDATYKTNRYHLVFVPFTGVDNHK